jgi:WhiB family redox-sensing transcriptional regulator
MANSNGDSDTGTGPLCWGMSPEIFYPIPRRGRPLSQEQIAQAVAICEQCPVQKGCLELGRYEDWGIWGGTTPEQRGAPPREESRGRRHGPLRKRGRGGAGST